MKKNINIHNLNRIWMPRSNPVFPSFIANRRRNYWNYINSKKYSKKYSKKNRKNFKKAVGSANVEKSGFLSAVSYLKDYIFFYPTVSSLTNFWNFGFISFCFLIIQIITGLLLVMFYKTGDPFNSTQDVVRVVKWGWMAKHGHSNGASFFFFYVYLHMMRSFYNFSYVGYKRPVWIIGMVIYVLMCLTAFTGYILPNGQMSYWAATVIVKLISTVPFVGDFIVEWLWGGPSVSIITLNRFFSIHFTLPFIIFFLVIIHVILLHKNGSSQPGGVFISFDKILFNKYYAYKDAIALLLALIPYFFMVGFYPQFLSHPDNNIPADPLVTPDHIVPEWYFLPFYAILRSVPDKTYGVLLMAGAILILFIFPFFLRRNLILGFVKRWDWELFDLKFNYKFSKLPFYKKFFWNLWSVRLKILFWIFICDVILLGYIGACLVEFPFYEVGQIATGVYFAYFFLLMILFDEKIILAGGEYSESEIAHWLGRGESEHDIVLIMIFRQKKLSKDHEWIEKKYLSKKKWVLK